jgi:hypothetical protein
MLGIDIIFIIFSAIDGIAFCVIASQLKNCFICESGALTSCAVFSFLSLIMFSIDLFLWSRETINLNTLSCFK